MNRPFSFVKQLAAVFIFVLYLFPAQEAFAANAGFKAVLLEGTAKIQRASTRLWDNMNLGDVAEVNDIVETYYQSKIALQSPEGAIILLGPNTRVLLSQKSPTPQSTRTVVTMFTGGVLVKTPHAPVDVFTSNAMAAIDSGTMSAIVESKTGNTGFQSLEGTTKIRNIEQQNSRPLEKGFTTIILPGKEPTSPLYLTNRHVAVLSHFFGDELIKKEITAAGLTPTDEGASGQTQSNTNDKRDLLSEDQVAKQIFGGDKIFTAVAKGDSITATRHFDSVRVAARPINNRFEADAAGGGAVAGGFYHQEEIGASVHGPVGAFGLRLPFSKDANAVFSPHFRTFRSILEKIDYADLGTADSNRYLHVGYIKDLSLGEGLIVSHFDAQNLQSAVRPTGLLIDLHNENAEFKAFVSDLASPLVGGLNLSIHPGITFANIGYDFDFNQMGGSVDPTESRFVKLDSADGFGKIMAPGKDSAKSSFHAMELGIGLDAQITPDIELVIMGQYARKFPGSWMCRVPDIQLELNRFRISAAWEVERGKICDGYMSSSYMTTRQEIDTTVGDTTSWYETPDLLLSQNRRAAGIAIGFGFSPASGISMGIDYKQDVVAAYTFMKPTGPDQSGLNVTKSSWRQDDSTSKKNFSLRISAGIDERLVPAFKYARIWAEQPNGGLFPRVGTYFASWTFRAGLDFLTEPFFLKMAFFGNVLFTYLDMNTADGSRGFNNNIEAGDHIIQMQFGLKWGYK